MINTKNFDNSDSLQASEGQQMERLQLDTNSSEGCLNSISEEDEESKFSNKNEKGESTTKSNKRSLLKSI